jgi:formamidopyrimidine-DNA glycosylase
MFEVPEYITLARQMNESLAGKIIDKGELGNSPHKFVWYNRTRQEFEQLTHGKRLGKAWVQGRWLFLPLEPGYLLLLGECGGKVLLHEAGAKLPKKYHLHLRFEDGAFLTVTTQMWGAMELYVQGKEQEREYVKDMRPTPVEPEFTLDYFNGLVDEIVAAKKQSAKGLLTQDQMIPGLGNAIAQDILFRARLHPRHPLNELNQQRRESLYRAIRQTVQEVIDQGGRYDEYDLYGRRGGYVRLMDSKAAGNPCPKCGATIKKINYLGGACYFCPQCQPPG